MATIISETPLSDISVTLESGYGTWRLHVGKKSEIVQGHTGQAIYDAYRELNDMHGEPKEDDLQVLEAYVRGLEKEEEND